MQSPSAGPTVDQRALLKLLRSTMAAVDHANKTENYSVLRDLGSSGFQANNSDSTLAGTFADIRNARIDLSDTLVTAPSFEFPPALIAPGLLRMRGRYGLASNAIGFDLVYEWEEGWRLHGIALMPFPTPRNSSP